MAIRGGRSSIIQSKLSVKENDIQEDNQGSKLDQQNNLMG